MKLAIQESLLSGDTLLERLEQAKVLGVDGIEFADNNLTDRVPEIAAGLQQTELRAAAVNAGTVAILHPEYEARENAIVQLRKAMTNAIDLGTSGVVFVPHDVTIPRLPDLHPYKSAIELEAELLVTQLRATLCDFAYALGADLYLAPRNHQQTHLIRQLEHAAKIMEMNGNHPHLKIAASTFHMLMEESDMVAAVREHGHQIGYIHLADDKALLPHANSIDFGAVIRALKVANYTGWLTLTADTDAINSAVLEAGIAFIRQFFQKLS